MSEKRMQIMRDASYLLPPPGGEVVRELLDRHASLLARHNALVEAVRPVVEWWESSPDGIPMRKGATEIMGLMTRKEAAYFDALAALVGEE